MRIVCSSADHDEARDSGLLLFPFIEIDFKLDRRTPVIEWRECFGTSDGEYLDGDCCPSHTSRRLNDNVDAISSNDYATASYTRWTR